MSNAKLDALLDQLRGLFEAEFARGEAAAVERFMQAVQAVQGVEAPKSNDVRTARTTNPVRTVVVTKQVHAPVGTTEALVTRVMAERATIGSRIQDIMNGAKTDEEKLVSYTSIRNALKRLEAKGTYVCERHLYYPAPRAQNETGAISRPGAQQPSVVAFGEARKAGGT